ncbi:OmpA family protein [Vibrio alginolyticus]|uniref:OmpA family protein n=1 Tax=Vibrio alginolyticus TaxID=663 RepID=UPI00211A6A04|nr:OmpA family protein [Vibrio alginolyticus]MCQ9090962.1 OmpA family protein [Vibrio alginolyticus]
MKIVSCLLAVLALPAMSHASTLYRTDAHAFHNDNGEVEITSQLVEKRPAPPPLPSSLSGKSETKTATSTTILSSDVLFDFDKSTIKDTSELRAVALALKSRKTHPVQIFGYTDSRGSVAYNLALSKRRADSVKRYLASYAPQHHYFASGRGEANPVATNMYEWGRKQNRRVTLSFN